MNEERDWIRWTERGLFLVGLLLLIQPVVSSKFFFTVDGPAHVYNASLLLDLFNSSAEERGWEVNPVPVPNWTGHILLALLQIFLHAPEALKVVYLMCLVGLPLVFRAVVKDHVIGAPWVSSLSFPMAMHLPFAMGYLNFTIGVILFLLVVHQWERLVRTSFAARQWLYLATLLLMLYFSHLVPFIFALIWLGLQWCSAAFDQLAVKGYDRRYWFRKAAVLGLCALPGLLCTMAYLFSSGPGDASLSNAGGVGPDRWSILFRPFQNVDGTSEVLIWKAFLFVVGAVVVGYWVDNKPDTQQPAKYRTVSLLVPGVASLVAGLLFATLPDVVGKGSDLLIRMTLLLHLCAFILIAFALFGTHRCVLGVDGLGYGDPTGPCSHGHSQGRGRMNASVLRGVLHDPRWKHDGHRCVPLVGYALGRAGGSRQAPVASFQLRVHEPSFPFTLEARNSRPDAHAAQRSIGPLESLFEHTWSLDPRCGQHRGDRRNTCVNGPRRRVRSGLRTGEDTHTRGQQGDLPDLPAPLSRRC